MKNKYNYNSLNLLILKWTDIYYVHTLVYVFILIQYQMYVIDTHT
jgi:hypothetical protein